MIQLLKLVNLVQLDFSEIQLMVDVMHVYHHVKLARQQLQIVLHAQISMFKMEINVLVLAQQKNIIMADYVLPAQPFVRHVLV